VFIEGSSSPLLVQLRQRLSRTIWYSKRFVAATLYSYSPRDLEAALRSLGITTDEAILVHSGFQPYSGFRGTPTNVIEVLHNVIGPGGNLLMMSIPYVGSSRRYAETDPLFDVLRSPSTNGIISEVFRRRAGVARSRSPLHPISASGPLAAWLVADHEKFSYSCGPGTPFDRFLSLNGKFLFIDAPYTSLTFMHYVEHSFRERLPVELYDPAAVTIRVKDASRRELQVSQFVFSEAARKRRNFAPVEQELRRRGLLRAGRVGNTHLLTVRARDVVDCAGRLVEQGTGFYR